MNTVSEIGREWLDFEASKLPPYPLPESTTLSGVLSEICGCEIDLTAEDLAMDHRIDCLKLDGPEVADALVRLADHIESWDDANGRGFGCPDVDRFRERLERLSSVIHPLWDGVCGVWLERDYTEGGDSAITSLARIDQILRACGLFELSAKLVPVVSSDAYDAVETADRLERELSRAAIEDVVIVKPRTVRALRSAAADLQSIAAATVHRGAQSLTQQQIANGSNASVRTVYDIHRAAGIDDKTGGVPYTSGELKIMMAKAKTGGTRKPAWMRVASFLKQVTS